MNNKEFITALAAKTGKDTEQVQKMVNQLCTSMNEIFDEGESLMVANFGTFETKKRLERIIVNPANNQRMLVPPKIVLTFKPATQVKESARKGGAE